MSARFGLFMCEQCRLFSEDGSAMPTNALGVTMPSGVNILSTVGRVMHLYTYMHIHARIHVSCWPHTIYIVFGRIFSLTT